MSHHSSHSNINKNTDNNINIIKSNDNENQPENNNNNEDNNNNPSNNNNYNNNINSNIMSFQSGNYEIAEYQKVINELEDELLKQKDEYQTLQRFYDDLKEVIDNNKEELNSLNERLINERNEKTEMENKYETEIDELNNKISTIKEEHSKQLLKLKSLYDPELIKNQEESKFESKYTDIINSKTIQIQQLQEQINEEKRNYDLLYNEYKQYKTDSNNEISQQKNVYEMQISELTQKLQIQHEKNFANENNEENETLINLKKKLSYEKKLTADLTQKLQEVSKQKDILFKERNEIKMDSLKDIDSNKFAIKSLQSEIERNKGTISNQKEEIESVKKNLEICKLENQKLTQEKVNLINELHDMERDYSHYKNDVKILRTQLQQKQLEDEKKLDLEHQEHKEILFKQRETEENYQKYIENLESELREEKVKFGHLFENSKHELNEAQRELLFEKEEGQKLRYKFNEVRDMLTNLEKKYQELDQKSKDKDSLIEDYKEQIKNLTIQFRNLQNQNFGDYFSAEQIKKKYHHYKLECQKANERYKIMFKVLKEDQIKQVKEMLSQDPELKI